MKVGISIKTKDKLNNIFLLNVSDSSLILTNNYCCDSTCTECDGITSIDCTKCSGSLSLYNNECISVYLVLFVFILSKLYKHN